MIGIYKITNPNGKIYIGQSININRRFKEYEKLLCKDSKKLYYSFLKYGVENHKFEILEICNIDILEERETYYILNLKTQKKGLNIKLGSKPPWSGKKRPEHSKWLKENGSGLKYKRTKFHKESKSLNMKNIWNKDRDNICKKISNNKIGKGLKPIICIENGQCFKSIKECSEIMGISKGSICSFVKGKYKYPLLKGLSFRYFIDNMLEP